LGGLFIDDATPSFRANETSINVGLLR